MRAAVPRSISAHQRLFEQPRSFGLQRLTLLDERVEPPGERIDLDFRIR